MDVHYQNLGEGRRISNRLMHFLSEHFLEEHGKKTTR